MACWIPVLLIFVLGKLNYYSGTSGYITLLLHLLSAQVFARQTHRINTWRQNGYPYLCEQGKKALVGILHRLRSIAPVPPKVMFKSFNTVVKPILIYGCNVWGCNRNRTSMVDKVMLRFCRCVLNVKATTSNIMVYGECGMLPPSIYCNVSAMCYINRLHHVPNDSIVKQVYNEHVKLHQLGFKT